LETAFDIRRALSTSALAAPAFAAAALGDDVLHSLRLDETVLLIAEITCNSRAPLCGEDLSALHARGLPVIATADADGTLRVTPPLQNRVKEGERIVVGASPQTFKTLRQLLGAPSTDDYSASPEQPNHAPRHPLPALFVLGEIHRHTHPALKVAVPSLLLLLLVSVLVFQQVFNASVVDALYFTITTITTVGYGDYHLKQEAAWVKLFACVVMLSSAALVAILFGIITDFVVSARFQETFGLRRSLLRGHIIIAGLGKVGYHIADYLDKIGENVVAVERNSDNDFVKSLRGRVPIVIGDARLPHVLNKAGIARAKAVVAATDDDLANLSVMLHAREVNSRIRTVIRIFDASRAQKMKIAFHVDAALSASAVAAPSFVAAALDPNAVRAFRLGEQLITLERLHLTENADWMGKTVAQLRESYGVIPLARRGRRGFDLLAPETRLRAGDEVVVAVPWRGME
jgi:Trk K+ transport system NAD-binding subunit